MADISQRALQTWYGNASWAEHNPMELGTYKGRISFNSLSNGNPITSLSLSINKTNTGGGGNFTFYATQNASIVGNTITSATLVGTLSFGSGAGTKTFTFTQAMMDIVKQYTGLWYLLIDSSVYITFTGGSGTSGPQFSGTYNEGSIWVNIGGVWHMGQPYVNIGGVWHVGTAYVNVGGVWKQGM